MARPVVPEVNWIRNRSPGAGPGNSRGALRAANSRNCINGTTLSSPAMPRARSINDNPRVSQPASTSAGSVRSSAWAHSKSDQPGFHAAMTMPASAQPNSSTAQSTELRDHGAMRSPGRARSSSQQATRSASSRNCEWVNAASPSPSAHTIARRSGWSLAERCSSVPRVHSTKAMPRSGKRWARPGAVWAWSAASAADMAIFLDVLGNAAKLQNNAPLSLHSLARQLDCQLERC